MPLSNYALNRYVARDITKFTSHRLKSTVDRYEQQQHWLSNCILNSIFGSPIADDAKPLVFSVVRRGEHALSEYEIARGYLEKFLNKGRSVSDYFRGISHLEVCLAAAYQCYEFVRKITNEKIFEQGDGSPQYKLNRVYNISKHLQKSTILENQLHLFWLTNTGLSCSELEISFEEIVDIMIDICDFVDRLSKLQHGFDEETTRANK
jgi:hypothetical protein